MGQVEIEFRTWGGKRKGAGRKPAGRRRVRHTTRPEFANRYPSHVTLRFVDGLPSMRRRDAFRAVRQAMFVVTPRPDFRIVHLSIQKNHVHLICEASDRLALARGVQGFKISAARRLNRALSRTGAIFADRYHAEIITTPTQMRAALCYVLNNWRKHGEDRGATVRVDPFSTGYHFRGWAEPDIPAILVIPEDVEILPSNPARTWLAREGWRRAPPISLHERPGQRPMPRA
jgi:REP element-mobilizing transposase RayT